MGRRYNVYSVIDFFNGNANAEQQGVQGAAYKNLMIH
jgi:hypothetical protein